jgi:hypothetical protein
MEPAKWMMASMGLRSRSRRTRLWSPISPSTNLASSGHGPVVPGRQIVENENVLAGAEKLKRHVASDKAHPTRDQNAHQATFSTAIVCNSSLAIGKRLRDF